MPSEMYSAMNQINQNSLEAQINQLKQRFGANADPNQILQKMIQSGQVSQDVVNATFAQVQQMFPRR